MATFVMTPLISAETWLGAAGWASGSQACSGTRPAFDPAPSRTSTRTSVRSTDGSASTRIAWKT